MKKPITKLNFIKSSTQHEPVPSDIDTPNKVINMKVKEKPIQASDMLSQLQSIYAAQIASFHNRIKAEGELPEKDLNSLNKLVVAIATLNKECREDGSQSILKGMSMQEQLDVLTDALDTLGVDISEIL